MKSIALLAGLFVCLTADRLQGAEIIRDNYTAANSTYTNESPFHLGLGVNSGINPPTTRLTGPLAPNLRYILRDTGKAENEYGINANKLRVTSGAGSGRIVLSANGSTPFDFAPALGIAGAKPSDRATYDVRISMDNDSTATERMSFAIGTADGGTGAWDFGIQLFRTATANTTYAIAHRVDTASSGNATDLLRTNNLNAGVFGTEISILMRVTDAGTETASFNSQVKLSLDGGNTWFYDTATDPALPNGFRFDAPTRFIMWDIAPTAAARYDNFSIDSTYAPPIPTATWTGGGADDNWSTAGNWGGTPLASGTAVIFNGTTRQVNVNDMADLTTPWLAFNNGDFSLSGNTFDVSGGITNFAGNNTVFANFSFSSTASKVWHIASGSEIVLSNSTTIDVNGDHNMYGGGRLIEKGTLVIGPTGTPAFIINEGQHVIDGGTHISSGGYRVGSFPAGPGAQSILTNSAFLELTASGANIRVGDSSHPLPARFDINNSTVTMAGGNFGVAYAAGSTGVVAQVGGTVSGCIVAFNDAGAGSGTYTVDNGTLEPIQIREDFTAGTSLISFNNALLRPASGANATAFFAGVDVADIQSGGLTIDATTDVTIAQGLSGIGSLTKTGGAAVTLTGANTYSGNTIVQTGKLTLITTQTNTSPVQVANGAELGVLATAQGSTLGLPSIALGAGSSSTLSFDLGAFRNPTAPLVKVPNLSVAGTVNVNIANGLPVTPGTFVLVDYDGSIAGGFNFTLASLPPGVSATLVNNTANTSIDLNITVVPGFRWTGAVNDQWDTTTANWFNVQTGSASTYSDGSPAEFFDGAATGLISIPGLPSPSVITISNYTLPYVLANGNLTTPLVRKFGTNSVTRVESGGDIITGIELNAGAYIVSNAVDTSLTTVLTDTSSGTGSFVKKGSSTLTVSSTNTTYDGSIVVAEGVLKLGSSSAALGSTNGSTTITNGGTLDLNDLLAPHEPVFVSGAGSTGQGAIIDSTAAGAVANNLTDVTMLGNTTFGSPNGGRWDIRVRSNTGPGPGIRGNGFNFTKVGSGSLSIACQRHFGIDQPFWDMNLGDIFVNEGSVTFAESLNLGNPAKTITVAPGATLGFYDLNVTNPIARNILVTDATITGGGGSATDTSVLNGAIQITGVGHLRPLDATLIVNGAITGSGTVAVSVSGAGTLLLNGASPFTGNTFVTNGTFGGTGSLGGNLTMIGGTFAPGSSGVGTFTAGGDVKLGPATRMELNRSLSPNSDGIVAGGTLTFSGTLTVVLASGAPSPQAGDVYQLFNKGASGSFTTVTLPNISALPGGLSWNTSNLSVNGSISVNGTATPPTIGSVSHSGNSLILSGTGGTEGASYVVLSSTNVATPVANWVPVSTNTFGTGGSFSYTNLIDPSSPTMFFMLRVP